MSAVSARTQHIRPDRIPAGLEASLVHAVEPRKTVAESSHRGAWCIGLVLPQVWVDGDKQAELIQRFHVVLHVPVEEAQQDLVSGALIEVKFQ